MLCRLYPNVPRSETQCWFQSDPRAEYGQVNTVGYFKQARFGCETFTIDEKKYCKTFIIDFQLQLGFCLLFLMLNFINVYSFKGLNTTCNIEDTYNSK